MYFDRMVVASEAMEEDENDEEERLERRGSKETVSS